MATNMRPLIVDGAPNLRDLGGYPAAGGKTVRFRTVFRSDDLSMLSDADVALLAGLNLRTVVDFRDRGEVEYNPDRFPESVRHRIHIPIEAGSLMNSVWNNSYNRDNLMGMMISVYRALVHDYRHAYADFFACLADPDNPPLLFHCTAGKDRTGLAAALLLLALGVDREHAVGDYVLSKECLLGKYQPGVDYDPVFEPLYSVEPEFIGAALEVIDNQYGGPERFLTEQLGANLPLLREMYTE